MRAAASKIQTSLVELAAARAFIEKGWDWNIDSEDIHANATAAESRYAALQMKLFYFDQFESSLQQAMMEAQANDMDVAVAALAIIEKPENAYIFQLFNGYDENGIYDGVVDETMKGRMLQLSLTIDRLRRQQSDIAIYSVAENYGNYLSNALNSYGSIGGLVAADPELYLSQMASLNPTAIKAKVQSISDVDFEKNIRGALNTLPPESQLYRSYLLSIIEKSPLQGEALKNQLLLAIDNYEIEMLASLEALTGTSFSTFRMQSDLELRNDVDESVVLFIDRYMNRGESAKSELLTLFGDIDTELNNALTLDSKKQLIVTEILARLKDAVYVSMVRDIFEIVENGTDIDLIEQSILSYANSLSNPTAAELLTAKESILIRTLRAMIAIGDSLDTFDLSLIPEEFRDFVLLYQYEQSEKRYADYQLLINSTVESEREAAVLDLRGIEADFAASILVKDFTEWQASHSATDYLAQANGVRSIEDYLSEYLNDRHTVTEFLPRAGYDIVKLVMQQEYSRLINDGSISGIGGLDERSYFTDFTDRIYIERVKDFTDQSGFVISGNVTADAQTYKNIFNAMLLQEEYSFNDLSFRERLVSTDDVNALFNIAFAYLYQQPSTQSYDPDVVRMLRNNDELNNLVTSESVLPDEWVVYRSNHPDYADLESHNYRIKLKEIANQFGIPKLYEELARIEATQVAFDRVGSGYIPLSLTEIADSDLDLAIELAGYNDLAGNQNLRNDIKRFLVTQSVVQSQTSLQNLMRQESLLEYHYGSESKRNSLEMFLASESEKIAHIEEAFFRTLEKADGRLRELAKDNRGDFFYHLINAVDSNLVLPSELNAPFTIFKQTFFDALTENEKSSLLEYSNDYRDFFSMRSSQELISSGLFEQIETEIFGNLAGADVSDSELAEARQYKSALMIGFIRSVRIENPTMTDVDNYLPSTIQGSLRSKVAESIARAINDIDPTFRMVLRKETVLLERFIDRYLETDVLRNELIAFLSSESDSSDFGSFATNQRIITEQNLADAEYGLLSHLEADKRAIVSLTNTYSIEQAVASRLMSFVDLRGSNVLQSRFVNYRTYADDGNNLFEAEYRKYLSTSTGDDRYLDVNFFDVEDESPVTGANGDEILTYHKFRQGMLLDTENALDSSNEIIQASSLKDMFADGSFITKLVSDEIKNDYDTIELDNDTVELRTVQRISYDSSVEPESQILEAYYAHLANNYLEALSNLNNNLLGLVNAASIVDGISSAKDQLEANVVAAELGDYAALRNSFEISRQAASDIKTNSGESTQMIVKSEIDSLEEALSNNKDQLGASGRRKHLKVVGQTMFVDAVFEPIATEFENARNVYNTLTDQALVLQNNYSEAISQYTQHLDEMGSWWRRFESVQSEAERRLAVKDYAETPYLFSASMSEETRLEALKEYASDAREEYRRASLLLEQANAQLKEAGYNVQIDINLAKFDRVVLALEDSVASEYIKLPLTVEEKNELEELRDRIYRQYNYLSVEEAREARNSAIDLDDLARLEELENREIYEQYGTLISERADYIKHTMRMIRLQKAKTLVQAEIQRLEIEVATNKEKFEDTLSLHFGDFSRIADEDERNEAIEARNTVYQRLASQYESGGTNFFNEMSAWYWLSGDWLADYGMQSMTQRLTATPNQVLVAGAALLYGGSISSTDKSAIGRWLSEKSGSVFSSFSGFSSLYFRMLVGIGIVKSIWWPVMLNASSTISDIMRRLFYQPWTAVMLPYWYLIYAEGKRQIGTAQAEYNVAQITSVITVLNLANYSNRNPGNAVGEAVTKQKAYEESKAKLEYFTKVPDLQTLKERLQKYGELQNDPDPELTAILYSLTEEDLRYLIELDEDNNIISLDSSGNQQILTIEEESEVFNAKTLQFETEYTDSFGRKYDRDQIITYIDPNYFGFYREGNVYRNANLSGEYTRIRVADHDGTIRFGYALLNEGVENKSVYNAGDILRSLVDHGNELREKRVNNYLLAGSELTDNGDDWSFILAERDSTMKDLFDESASKDDGEGGREFAGYTMVYADYEANQKAVFDLELQQRVNVQRKEWDLREQELLARTQEWEARIEAMLKAGNRAWTDAEDRFLSEWREWEQEFDRKIEEGNQEWDQRIAEHMTDRQQWETDLKQKASEAASEAALTEVLGGFNVQLQTLAANAGISMTPINLNDAVEKAKSEIIANLPTQVEQLASINESIERFNTNVSLSEMWGTDTQSVLAGLATEFHNEMNQFQKQMVVYSNSKVMAQYQQLLNDLLEQIDRQNRAIEQQTELAAMQAGFIRSGNVYIKQSKLVSSAVGMVEAYQWFDGKAAFDDYLSSIGDGYGGALVGDQNGNVTHKSRDEIMADLPAFLETADTVQVESFFAVQKMILQNAFAKIMGTGSASERQ
ncbi:MAG: hypothetical protein H3C43_02460, partial [Leptonema sp. (in: Bacteria)]|nr:hypothetical protein [Leptonema sp. (in: bacteria)]